MLVGWCIWGTICKWMVRWKKGLRFLLKTELCQKGSKFACSFLYVGQTMFCMFFPWSLLPFWNITYAKKHIFLRPSSGDLLLNEKQKKPFVSLKHGVSIIQESPTVASLAQVAKALNGLDSSLFCPDAGSIGGGGRSIFFFAFSFSTLFKTQDIYLSSCLCNWSAVFNRFKVLGWILWRRLLARKASITSIAQIQNLPVN